MLFYLFMFQLNLKQKIVLIYVSVFLVFVGSLFPFALHTVKRIVIKSMDDRTSDLIERIALAPDNEALVEYLKKQKSRIFFRVSVITNERKLLYDSHTKRLLGPNFSQEYVVNHPEVLQALQEGNGYHISESKLLGQKFAYFAKTFDFHGKTYVIRTAFPYKYISDLTHDFELGFLLMLFGVLLLFSAFTWFLMYRLTRPIDQIITAIRPYQEGREITVPEISVSPIHAHDEFGRLAHTLNSLSRRIQRHINTLTMERNEKVAILESLVEGVISLDRYKRISFANSMASKLLGKEKQSIIGLPFASLGLPIGNEIVMECQREGQPKTASYQSKIGGKKISLDLVAVPTKGGSGTIMVLQDTSFQYKMLEMRKDFVANASHELKTPITIIRGFAESLHDHPDLPLETRLEVTRKIVKNCKRMTTVIKDLLTLSDIENIPSHRISLCDLQILVEKGVKMLFELFPKTQLKIHNPRCVNMQLNADPDLIELAIFNLLENAAKYSNSPAQITVTLDGDPKALQCTVADQGIGIPQKDLEHIFQRFYTVNKVHSQKMGGSGLGLSIVETIIDKHKGKISVESQVGVGTTFSILLPRDVENGIS